MYHDNSIMNDSSVILALNTMIYEVKTQLYGSLKEVKLSFKIRLKSFVIYVRRSSKHEMNNLDVGRIYGFHFFCNTC